MQKASVENPGGMATIMFGHDAQLNTALQNAKQWAIDRGIENADCVVANYLFPDCKVISGSLEALKYIEANLKTYKLKKMRRLPVSGAFHSSLMQPAVEPFSEALKNIFIQDPMVDVYSNVYGEPHRGARDIISALSKQVRLFPFRLTISLSSISKLNFYVAFQIVRPVKWEQMLHTLYTRDQDSAFPPTYFCGPGTALKTILKQVNARAWERSTLIGA